ncbi:MAG: hypothetical protein Q9168_003092 [Polycauliona sp. 1 TL-2023]
MRSSPHSSRSGSKDKETTLPTPPSLHPRGPPTSFFLATEDMLSRARGDPDGLGFDSLFGVQSLQESLDTSTEEPRHMGDDGQKPEDHERRRSTLRATPNSREQSRSQSPRLGFPGLKSTLPSVSSLSQDSQGAPPSPKSSSSRSYRPSDLDSVYDSGSQAIASSEDEADIAQPSDSAPQLVMPSMVLPSRRPFTERGKSINRLKILVAGDSGLGKTSLINSSVEQLPKASHVNEIWASTKAYPGWKADIEENKPQRRRKSFGETILERNICFVDTAGYGRGLSITEGIQAVISYVENQIARPFGNTSDLVEIKPADFDYLRRLSEITNVIPLLAQADTIASEDLAEVKAKVSRELERSGIVCFSFDTDEPIKPPYAVCSAPSNDEENMDASTLMQSDYITPLLKSDLSFVADQLLQPDNINRLRHLSAKKLVQSKTAMKLLSSAISGNSTASRYPTTTVPSSQALTIDYFHPPFHPQDRLAEYTRQEDKRTQIRLAKWANDARATMRNERAQIEQLHHLERRAWLEQKLEECHHDSLSLDYEKNSLGTEESATNTAIPFALANSSFSNDPLGLLRYDEYLRRHGWQIFQIVGTFGLFGAAAWWIAREWSTSSSSSPWVMRADGSSCSEWTFSDWTFSWIQHGCRPSLY